MKTHKWLVVVVVVVWIDIEVMMDANEYLYQQNLLYLSLVLKRPLAIWVDCIEREKMLVVVVDIQWVLTMWHLLTLSFDDYSQNLPQATTVGVGVVVVVVVDGEDDDDAFVVVNDYDYYYYY